MRWEDPRGFGFEWARSQPGGPRRRQATWWTENGTVTAGDLDPWKDSPLLEGASRRRGPSTRDEREAWRRGSGMLPNGLESEGRWGSFRIRSRVRDDRDKTEDLRSAAMELAWGGFHAGIRTEDPTGEKCATAGWRNDRWNLSGLGLVSGFSGARLRRGPGPEGISGEARWVSARVRHGGVPSDWPGVGAASMAWENPAHDPLLDNLRGEVTLGQEEIRTRASSLWRRTWEPVRFSVGPSVGWNSASGVQERLVIRLQRAEPRGWQPSLEASWTDSTKGGQGSVGGALAHGNQGRKSAVGGRYGGDGIARLFLEQSGTLLAGGHSIELSLRLRTEAATQPRTWAEGGIECHW